MPFESDSYPSIPDNLGVFPFHERTREFKEGKKIYKLRGGSLFPPFLKFMRLDIHKAIATSLLVTVMALIVLVKAVLIKNKTDCAIFRLFLDNIHNNSCVFWQFN